MPTIRVWYKIKRTSNVGNIQEAGEESTIQEYHNQKNVSSGLSSKWFWYCRYRKKIFVLVTLFEIWKSYGEPDPDYKLMVKWSVNQVSLPTQAVRTGTLSWRNSTCLLCLASQISVILAVNLFVFSLSQRRTSLQESALPFHFCPHGRVQTCRSPLVSSIGC